MTIAYLSPYHLTSPANRISGRYKSIVVETNSELKIYLHQYFPIGVKCGKYSVYRKDFL